MKSKTHIVVVRMKEIIYTAVFLVFAVILILLLVFMFGSRKNDSDLPAVNTSSTYIPGVYTSSLVLNNNTVDVAVTVDGDHINGVSLVNLEESVATMYPLLETCMEDISTQLAGNVPLSEITYDASSQYTYQLLTQSIEKSAEQGPAHTAVIPPVFPGLSALAGIKSPRGAKGMRLQPARRPGASPLASAFLMVSQPGRPKIFKAFPDPSATGPHWHRLAYASRPGVRGQHFPPWVPSGRQERLNCCEKNRQ